MFNWIINLYSSLVKVIPFIITWIMLYGITMLAVLQIKDILENNNQLELKANLIAIMIGLGLTVTLFKHPFFNTPFPVETSSIFEFLLYALSLVAGWMVWYLRGLNKYGDFFQIFLSTIIAGVSWYVKLGAATITVEIIAISFILGSLFRLSKGYLDLVATQNVANVSIKCFNDEFLVKKLINLHLVNKVDINYVSFNPVFDLGNEKQLTDYLQECKRFDNFKNTNWDEFSPDEINEVIQAWQQRNKRT